MTLKQYFKDLSKSCKNGYVLVDNDRVYFLDEDDNEVAKYEFCKEDLLFDLLYSYGFNVEMA